MGMIEAKVKWSGGIRFEGISQFGLPIATDGSVEAGGTENGYKPTEMVLFGVAGCTGIDIVRILNKMRQEITGVEIEVKAFHPDEYPKPFSRIEIKYIFTGRNLEKDKIEKAINLSDEKYCMVSQTLKGMAKIITSYEIIEG
jgi:putative redox protein